MTHKYLELNDSNFNETVLKTDRPVLVDFWATWCGPCRMFAPTISAIAEEYDGKAIVAKVDVDAAPSVAERYGIMNIPTVVLFKNGNEVARSVGTVPQGKLEEMIDSQL